MGHGPIDSWAPGPWVHGLMGPTDPWASGLLVRRSWDEVGPRSWCFDDVAMKLGRGLVFRQSCDEVGPVGWYSDEVTTKLASQTGHIILADLKACI